MPFKEEGRDEENIVMGRMALNKLGYKDLSEYMNKVYGNDFFNPDETEDMVLDNLVSYTTRRH